MLEEFLVCLLTLAMTVGGLPALAGGCGSTAQVGAASGGIAIVSEVGEFRGDKREGASGDKSGTTGLLENHPDSQPLAFYIVANRVTFQSECNGHGSNAARLLADLRAFFTVNPTWE
jgi:hypothetical protein